MYRNSIKSKFFFSPIVFSISIMIFIHLITSGRLTGDALIVYNSLDTLELFEFMPRQYFHYFYFSFFKMLSIFFLSIFNLENSDYLIQVIISHSGAVLWVSSVLLLLKTVSASQNKDLRLIIIFFCFSTPYLYLSSEFATETFICFLLSLFYSIDAGKNKSGWIFLAIIFFLISFIKIYLIPLIVFLTLKTSEHHRKNVLNVLPVIIGLNLLIYFGPQLFFDARESALVFVDNIGQFWANISYYFFSINFGFIISFHLFSLFFLNLLSRENGLLLLLNIFYISLFCSLPYWHGDMIGCRFMMPLYLVNLMNFIKIVDVKLISKYKRSLLTIMTIIWLFSINTLDYRVQSFNNFYAGSVWMHPDLQKDYKAENNKEIFSYSNFPYYDFQFHPLIFSNKVVYYKSFSKDKNLSFSDNNIEVPLRNIYPRRLYSLISYLSDNTSFFKRRLSYINETISYQAINKILKYISIFSTTFLFMFPLYLIYRK